MDAGGNCDRKLKRLVEEGKVPLWPMTLTLITTCHDDWCALLVRGEPCDCDPYFLLPDGTRIE